MIVNSLGCSWPGVFFNRLGELRDRTYENQQHRASGLNLVVAAIALWNTVYLERAIRTLLERGFFIDQRLLAHLSPLKWEHINLTGDEVTCRFVKNCTLTRGRQRCKGGVEWSQLPISQAAVATPVVVPGQVHNVPISMVRADPKDAILGAKK